MTKSVVVVFTIMILTSPATAFGSIQTCRSSGHTVVFVNGIQTTREDADIDRKALNDKYSMRSSVGTTVFLTGYNPTHLGGIGDKFKSMIQTFAGSHSGSVNDYDLTTILLQLHEQIATQKVLLVGHSQGTFYTNALYEYLTTHGLSPESVMVYNIGTPANYVAGGGQYLTSTNDGVIEYVRELDKKAGAPVPLPANIAIPIPYDEKDAEWKGHGFQHDYLEGAPGQMMIDMQGALKQLRSRGEDTDGPCFVAPQAGIGFATKKAVFAIADTAAGTTQNAGSALASAARAMQAAAGNAIASAVETVLPSPTPETQADSMKTVRALYGTSLDDATLQELAAEKKANEAAAAAAAAAREEALRNAPRVEAFRTLNPEAQTASASDAFDALQQQETEAVPVPMPAVPPTVLIPVQPGYGGGGGSSAPPADTQSTSMVATESSTTTESAATSTSEVATTTPETATTTPDTATTTPVTLPDSGWFCPLRDSEPPVEEFNADGAVIASPDATCSFVMRFLGPSLRYLGIFKGSVGSSTLVSAYLAGTGDRFDTFVSTAEPSGTELFHAIFEIRPAYSNMDLALFTSYFTGAPTPYAGDAAVTDPPSSNWRVFRWRIK